MTDTSYRGRSRPGTRVHDVALCAALAAVWLAVAFSTHAASAVVAAWSSLALAVVLLACRLIYRRTSTVRSEHVMLLVLAGLLPLALLASASLADNAHVSLLGMIGQRTGGALWVGAWAWFAVGLLDSSPRRLAWLVKTLAVAGTLAALVALIDAAGLLEVVGRFSDEPAGIFDSSLSLGQTLLVTGAAAFSWYAFERSPALRIVAATAAALQAIALAYAASRSALFGLAAGTVVVVALRLTRGKPSARRNTGWVLTSLSAGAATLIIALLLLAGPETDLGQRIDDLSSDRWTIWTSALAQTAQTPILGKGPDQFTCWTSWTVGPAGQLETHSTGDPHSIVFYMLVGGGVLGTATLGVGSAAATRSLWRASRTGTWAVVALAGGLTAWATSLAFAWISPLAFTCAATLSGTLIGADRTGDPSHMDADDKEPGSPGSRRTALAATAVVIVALLACATLSVAQAPGARLELHRWATNKPGVSNQIGAVENGLATREPAYAYQMLQFQLLFAAAAPADAKATPLDEAEDLARKSQSDRQWHVDLALTGAELALARSTYLGEDTWRQYTAAIEAGRHADPTSGLWDYATWLEARRLGLDEEAEAAARRAMAFPLPPGALELMSENNP